MRVDLLYGIHNRSGNASWAEALEETRAHAVMADELGYDGIWFGEHHFDTDGFDACPNPILMAADIAARTKNIRLGLAAVQLTLWHPLKLAEDLAMLDHFSGGRVDPGFARGIVDFEVMNINPAADRWSNGPAASEGLFEENFHVLRKAMTEDPFSYTGERYTFPYPGLVYKPAFGDINPRDYADENGIMVALGVVPLPVQKPTPPMYAVTESLGGFEGAARRDIGAITWYPTKKGLRQLFHAYEEGMKKHHGVEVDAGLKCGVLRIALVADSDEEARAITEKAVVKFTKYCNDRRKTNVWVDVDEDPNDPSWTDETMYDKLMERDHLMIGSAESVLARIKRMSEETGTKHWLLQMGFPGLNREQVEKSVRLFGEKVLPELKKL